MKQLAVTEMINSTDNYYSLVVGVAKRARDIAREAEENRENLSEKPVQTAMEEYYNNEFYLTLDGKKI